MKVSLRRFTEGKHGIAISHDNTWTWQWLQNLTMFKYLSLRYLPNRGGYVYSVTTINVRKL